MDRNSFDDLGKGVGREGATRLTIEAVRLNKAEGSSLVGMG